MWNSHPIDKFVREHCQYRWIQVKLFDASVRECDIESFLLWPDLPGCDRTGQCIQPCFSESGSADFKQNVTGGSQITIAAYDKPLNVLKVESISHMQILYSQ